jgi:hypothetical protein
MSKAIDKFANDLDAESLRRRAMGHEAEAQELAAMAARTRIASDRLVESKKVTS